MSDEHAPEPNDIDQNAEQAGEPPENADDAGDTGDTQALLEQIQQLKDTQLRLAAESQNVRRRAEADVEKARKFGAEKLVREMLPVADSFERALEAARVMEGFDSAMLEGIEATFELYTQALAKNGLTPINPVDELFDPARHQAISMVPAPVPANTVVDVVQTGYALNDRVLRAAMVVVSQGAPSVDDSV
ncbi:nucleotide exchange factor GrpE [Litorivicinus lipolyticus]|uniref:Protein GrpE n=1 Tax=Litorivicinus lipolyticus TaxID=418701 RepID=A0A5Q2Q920_9GAMM|nr:nucleotide exchange factor GrpE [Litorivicinus lipolyticus]QGG79384.1 nucleotide exchange factor GrpE [Litorivicinus lipolyticus]